MTLKLIPYLVMNGNAKQAIDFYVSTLDARLLASQSFGDQPANPEYPIPEEMKDRIMHATLQIGESVLMLSDTFAGQPHQIGTQVTICISLSDADRAKKIFEALQAGGQVTMPLQETFFSPAYGLLVDKFGVTFQIYTEAKH
ncbi:VOC family protein [Paenibacillus chartarius]|uniref:VOC family protein n=1 Tax=Paenibacillus chartarius TaxID=747481 RepID=A0ABV6DHT0_9BACL